MAPAPGRIAMLGADGAPLGWSYDAERYELVRGRVLEGADALRGLGEDPRFPSGRLTNATRHVAADLRGRGVLERAVPASPQRVRRR